MADVNRDVRELGQKITGLKAGDNVTLKLKKPKPKVDATAAKKTAAISEEHLDKAHDCVAALARARDSAHAGDSAGAKAAFKEAKDLLGQVQAAVPSAKNN